MTYKQMKIDEKKKDEVLSCDLSDVGLETICVQVYYLVLNIYTQNMFVHQRFLIV